MGALPVLSKTAAVLNETVDDLLEKKDLFEVLLEQ